MKSVFTKLVIGWIFLAGIAARAGELQLADPFGTGMVLQRQTPVPVWGTAQPGTTVTVQFAGQSRSAKADASGRWRVQLGSLRASNQGQELTVTSGDAKVTLKDVLVGEVWICSGQSNMEWGIQLVNNAQEEIAAADYPAIRLRYVNKVKSPKPLTAITGSAWMVCSPPNIVNGTQQGFSAVAYFFGRELNEKLNVPVGLIQSAWGATRIEPWTPPHGDLYNAMIHPWAGFPIRGAVWYQGESNCIRGDGLLYAEKMNALIAGWRKAWGAGEFPFYFVQLAPFIYKESPDHLPALWEAQTAALAIPNTGMAIINDIGNVRDIHPRNKQDVGKRLARLALARTYRARIADDSGPLFKRVVPTGNRIRIEFSHVSSGLASRDQKPLTHFEVAGADGKFVPAEAQIAGRTVVARSALVPAPKYVRFAWRQDAVPNLMNGDGLPAAAFRVGPAAASGR
jgi:sialate O-acetylesterase